MNLQDMWHSIWTEVPESLSLFLCHKSGAQCLILILSPAFSITNLKYI
ncbi:MAG: hypothetical protein AWU59_1805 [Methanolobus sp. T82-4]|jgi:hypothetical protein|nr:MAG: hypothetical protein AWU59_1805 [Methanolobus sp. T82-4]